MLRTLLLCAVASAAASAEVTADEVRKVETAWAAAVKAGDFKTVDSMLAEGLVYTHSTAIVENKAEYMAKLKTGIQKYNGIDYSDVKVSVYGNTGVVASRVRMHGATKGVPFDNNLLMLHVWVKQGGKWLLAAHQTTRVP